MDKRSKLRYYLVYALDIVTSPVIFQIIILAAFAALLKDINGVISAVCLLVALTMAVKVILLINTN